VSEYVYANTASQTIDIFLQDSSSSTGQGLSGLVFNSASLVASYRKGATGSRTAITLATQTVGGAYSSGGFVEIDATNMKGVYRLDIPNAAVDTEGFVTLYLYGATNLLPTALRIDCRALPVDVKKISGDTQSATDLKDFADAGYDPATNKVQGVVLVDTTAVLDSADKATLVNLIWDEPLTGATHNVATSSGKRLRQTTAFQQIDSTVIDAAATTTTFVTGLTSSVDNFYNDSMLVFTDGALAGQVRAIYDYIGATKTIVLEEALTSAPVDGVAFAIVSLHIHPVSQIQSGLATAAALATESTKINRIEAVATGTVTGAGTSTEVFVGPSATLTITVDSSGNRSAVVVT
jgi:hypothetical protein